MIFLKLIKAKTKLGQELVAIYDAALKASMMQGFSKLPADIQADYHAGKPLPKGTMFEWRKSLWLP